MGWARRSAERLVEGSNPLEEASVHEFRPNAGGQLLWRVPKAAHSGSPSASAVLGNAPGFLRWPWANFRSECHPELPPPFVWSQLLQRSTRGRVREPARMNTLLIPRSTSSGLASATVFRAAAGKSGALPFFKANAAATRSIESTNALFARRSTRLREPGLANAWR